MNIKLTAAIATFNEEENIKVCLESVKDLVDEIVIVDGSSIDKTVDIAKSFGAKVMVADNPPNFHINKQKAFDLSLGEWVLCLDADERVSNALVEEIRKIIDMSESHLEEYQQNLLRHNKLFLRHQQLLEQRDGPIGTPDGAFVAFFFPRKNYFLGKYLRFGGVYPDGVIRLFKKGKAYLPCKDVHEQMVVLGRVGWLQHDLLHNDSPTFSRYLKRNDRYVHLIAADLKNQKIAKNPMQFVNYCLLKSFSWFMLTQIRHKGILDGWQGVVFSFFSALRFPRAYLEYLFS